MSDHPHDIVTVFVIFVRQDYGAVQPDSLVIDIGANIGIYSLYAAYHKARKVAAYEPNAEAFQCLQHNIQANHLEQRIEPHRLAVTDGATKMIRFPKQSSMYNAIVTGGRDADVEEVETISLAAILGKIERVELLKLDCEGSEYDILMKSSQDVLEKVDDIRMEYHLGRSAEIESFLSKSGFVQRHVSADTEVSGMMWHSRIRKERGSGPELTSA